MATVLYSIYVFTTEKFINCIHTTSLKCGMSVRNKIKGKEEIKERENSALDY